MSQVTIFFGVAPAIAPIIGGWVSVHLGWHAVFWCLTGIGALLWLANWRLLPESLPPADRQRLHLRGLLQSYWELGTSPRFLLLSLASGVPFNGMFLYVLSAPAFLGDTCSLGPTAVLLAVFLATISGIMGGAWASGRLAGRIAGQAADSPRLSHHAGLMALLNLAGNLLAGACMCPGHCCPCGMFSFGWALMVPVVTLLVLDLYPQRRGMASSLQAFIGSSAANGLVAGVVAPLVMHSATALATTSLAADAHWPGGLDLPAPAAALTSRSARAGR
jgi:DHA1 family bicyclomycin/chloramphenicol resistance-like MFS transporter